MVNINELPNGWIWSTLENELLSLESGGRPKGGVRKIQDGIPSIGGEHLLYSGGFDFSNIRYIPKNFYESLARGKIKTDDVLVVKDGATTGKTGYVSSSFPFSDAAVNEHVFILRVEPSRLLSKFLFYWMQSPLGQKCVKENFKGTAQGGINSSFIKNSKLPLPPLPEQERIVAKIEELFTQLDAGTAALKRAQAGLKRYEASVLKAAVEGKLISNSSSLRDLPPGWKWTNVGNVILDMKNGIYKPAEYYSETGIACLRMYNIDNGGLVWKDIKRINLTEDEYETYRLNPGDILINRVNSRELVGKATVIPEGLELVIYESKNIRLRVKNELILSKFLNYCLQVYGHQYFNFNAQQVVGMASINQTQIAQMLIPLPPIIEQGIIIEEVERRLSVITELSEFVKVSIIRAERIRQSILKKAFEGTLV